VVVFFLLICRSVDTLHPKFSRAGQKHKHKTQLQGCLLPLTLLTGNPGSRKASYSTRAAPAERRRNHQLNCFSNSLSPQAQPPVLTFLLSLRATPYEFPSLRFSLTTLRIVPFFLWKRRWVLRFEGEGIGEWKESKGGRNRT
jgi:hypothetical protein